MTIAWQRVDGRDAVVVALHARRAHAQVLAPLVSLKIGASSVRVRVGRQRRASSWWCRAPSPPPASDRARRRRGAAVDVYAELGVEHERRGRPAEADVHGGEKQSASAIATPDARSSSALGACRSFRWPIFFWAPGRRRALELVPLVCAQTCAWHLQGGLGASAGRQAPPPGRGGQSLVFERPALSAVPSGHGLGQGRRPRDVYQTNGRHLI